VAVLEIAQLGHPGLRLRGEEVSREELNTLSMQQFIDDLVDTMHQANGAGLAATQVLCAKRIVAIEVKDNPRYPYKPNIPLTILVNPVIEPISDDRFDNYEGCLSVPNLRGVVSRNAEVRVTGWDRHGAPIERLVRGLSAGTYQHEVDHLDGLLFVDRVTDTKTLCTWGEFDKHYKKAFVERIVPFIERMGG
jgi:peptide deformylase